MAETWHWQKRAATGRMGGAQRLPNARFAGKAAVAARYFGR